MSDEEMEEFSVNDEDMRRAFNPGMRAGRRQNRDEATYGIFAGSSSEDDDDGGGGGGKRGRGGFRASFGGGNKYGFKSSGGQIGFVKSSSSNKKRHDYEDDDGSDSSKSGDDADDKITDEEEDDRRERENDGEIHIDDSSDGGGEDDGDDDEDERKTQKSKKEDKSSNKKYGLIYAEPRNDQSREAQAKPKAQPVNKGEIKEIGNWEKYTKGFGAKMLQKMGWEKGKGIGKEMQGRAVPVEATLRKGKGSVGAYGAESKELARKRREEDDGQDDDQDDDESKPHVSQWRKDKKGKKPQYSLKSADELLKMATKKNPKKLKMLNDMETRANLESIVAATSAKNKIKVIDMTGKEQRVLHGYEALSQMGKLAKRTDEAGESKQQQQQQQNFDVPELVHNIDMLLDMTIEKILLTDKKLKHYDDSLVSIAYDEKRTREKLDAERRQHARMSELLETVERLEETSKTETDLNKLIETFRRFQTEYADEFIIYNLSDEAIPFVRPLLSKKMLAWQPFTRPHDEATTQLDYCKSTYEALRSLLDDQSSSHSTDDARLSPYQRIVWETWMPAVRAQLASVSLREFGAECVDLLLEWSPPLVPAWIRENVLEQIVLPKLSAELELWNPLTDRVPIHTWIHPWLPLMKPRLDSALFPTIRFKLTNALVNWHPSDESARAILRPWRPPVWPQPHWDAFMLRSILPKLEYAISHELVLSREDGSAAEPEAWQWVAAWIELCAPAHFVDLVERCFFPKWFHMLSSWLNSKPDYEQVADWYNAWKTRFGDRLNQHPSIKSKFTHALIMMDRSMKGAQVSYSPAADTATSAQRQQQQQAAANEQLINESARQMQLQQQQANAATSFKDVIERKAAENNLVFLPIANKFKEGKQVYRFGTLNIYLEGNVIFMWQQSTNSWRPTSIAEMVQKSQS